MLNARLATPSDRDETLRLVSDLLLMSRRAGNLREPLRC